MQATVIGPDSTGFDALDRRRHQFCVGLLDRLIEVPRHDQPFTRCAVIGFELRPKCWVKDLAVQVSPTRLFDLGELFGFGIDDGVSEVLGERRFKKISKFLQLFRPVAERGLLVV